MDFTKEQIREELRKEYKAFSTWFTNQKLEAFALGPEGAWTAGQHLHHIIKSTKALSTGLAYPKIVPRLIAGTSRLKNRSYEGMVNFYKRALADGGKASGKYRPRPTYVQEKEALLERLDGEAKKLIDVLDKWSEKQMDHLRLPHPLLGKITVREMLYFTIYHTQHHRMILEERYNG